MPLRPDNPSDDRPSFDVPIIRGPLSEVEALAKKEQAYKDWQIKFQQGQRRTNWLIVILTLISAGAAIYSATQAQKANELNAKIIKGGSAAFFDPTFVFSASGGYVDIGFQNQGKVLARNFASDLIISRKSVPGLAAFGKIQKISLRKGAIQPVRPSLGQTVQLDDFSDGEKQRIEQTAEIIAIEDSYEYDNGFGDIVREPICFWYVDLRPPGGGGSSGFMACEDAKAAITRMHSN